MKRIYTTPAVEILEIDIERGFAATEPGTMGNNFSVGDWCVDNIGGDAE